jgi:HAE1 family hydrophobic/amphiphilic exporter-1
MSLPRLAVGRPIGAIIIYSIVLLIGLISLVSLPIDLLPDITFPRLTISTDYPGAGPEEVENLVSRILEEAVSSVAGVQDVTSTSSEGSSRVTITFPFGRDLDAAAADVRVAIERTRRRLPDGVETPVVFKFDPSQFPIVQLGIVGRENPGPGLVQLREIAEDQLLFRLERIPGVSQATISGGLRRQIRVELDRARVQALAVSEREVVNALASANLAAPGGQVTEGTRRLGLRVLNQYRDLGQVRRTIVAVRNGAAIYVGDIAQVSEGTEDQTALVRINGQSAVLVSVLRQPGTNTVAVADRILHEAETVGASSTDARIVVVTDSARFIRQSIHAVQQAVLIGGVLAVGVLGFFLRDLRSVLIIGTAIPISVLATFSLMYFFGYTLNLMTLGGIALGIGHLVDGAIVVLENILRYRERGYDGREAAVRGTQEVASAVTASILTTAVVFLPIIFAPGGAVITQLFSQFATVVIFSQLCSLIVALTLIPVLASRLPPMSRSLTTEGWVGRVIITYRGMLQWALQHRRTAFALSTLVFLVGASSFMLLGREVIPLADEGEIQTSVWLPVGTRLDLTEQALVSLERAAREGAPEIAIVTLSAGSAAFGGGSHRGNLRIRLVEKGHRDRSTEEVAVALRRRLQVPGGRVVIRPSAGALAVLRFGGADPVAVDVRGFDLAAGMGLAQQIRTSIEEIPGIIDASIAREEQLPEVVIRVDAQRAAAFGLTTAQISQALRTEISGAVATILREGGRERDVVVRLRGSEGFRPSEILSLPIITPGGQRVLLGQVADLARGEGPAQIFRRGRQRVITVNAGISGRDFGSVMSDVRAQLIRLTLPEGFSLALGDEYEQQQRAYRQLAMGFLVAVVLVFAVMAVQFEAALEPVLIMGAIPFALSGAFLTLFLTNTTLNIQSLIGLIVLVGLVVGNAIVLIDFILTLRRRDGVSLHDAAVEASALRLRPVLMTTVTTIVGLLPVAIGFGEGAELEAPLARSVVGGLTLSTLVTLVFIPTLYVTVEEFRARRRTARAPEPAPVAATPAPVTGGGNGEHSE